WCRGRCRCAAAPADRRDAAPVDHPGPPQEARRREAVGLVQEPVPRRAWTRRAGPQARPHGRWKTKPWSSSPCWWRVSPRVKLSQRRSRRIARGPGERRALPSSFRAAKRRRIALCVALFEQVDLTHQPARDRIRELARARQREDHVALGPERRQPDLPLVLLAAAHPL